VRTLITTTSSTWVNVGRDGIRPCLLILAEHEKPGENCNGMSSAAQIPSVNFICIYFDATFKSEMTGKCTPRAYPDRTYPHARTVQLSALVALQRLCRSPERGTAANTLIFRVQQRNVRCQSAEIHQINFIKLWKLFRVGIFFFNE
jgi:hypothetical protein